VKVFSNTTPFIALASIDQLQLLPQLFGRIYVAQSVIEECAEGGRILVPHLQSLSWVISIADESSSNLPAIQIGWMNEHGDRVDQQPDTQP
jgi:hypothetical protein